MQALLNAAVVCAGVGATIGTAILMFAPPDTIVKASCKNSYQVGFRYFRRRNVFDVFDYANVFDIFLKRFLSCSCQI